MGRPTNTQFAVGVHVLTLLAGAPDEPMSSEEMAASVNANPVYVRRVLGSLRRAGLVASRPGVHGGWQPTRDPGEVTLADVWRPIQGDDPVLGLHDANPSCPVGREIQRTLSGIDRRAAQALEAELDGTRVRDVLPGATPVQRPIAPPTSAAGPPR
jgi:Rrf2 family protein